MKITRKMLVCFLLTLILAMNSIVPVVAAQSNSTLDTVCEDTAEFIYKTVSNPQVGSIGGEWAVLALARSEYDVAEEYYERYYEAVKNYVKSLDGNLHDRKYTEYSRLIVALTSIGKDPADVGGYNLLTPLGDYDKTIWQGFNGAIWALIALDSGDYPIPENKNAETQATRDMYIQYILESQLSDGGWALSRGTVSDPDITGIALQALAKYQDRSDVKKTTEEALEYMSKEQNSSGGFKSWGTENSEICVQMIVALGELGIPLDDPRFVKNGNTLLDSLMRFYVEGRGFLHSLSSSAPNLMASEQALYGLVAAQRLRDGKNSLYRMGDVVEATDGQEIPSDQLVLEMLPNINILCSKVAQMLFNLLGISNLL